MAGGGGGSHFVSQLSLRNLRVRVRGKAAWTVKIKLVQTNFCWLVKFSHREIPHYTVYPETVHMTSCDQVPELGSGQKPV